MNDPSFKKYKALTQKQQYYVSTYVFQTLKMNNKAIKQIFRSIFRPLLKTWIYSILLDSFFKTTNKSNLTHKGTIFFSILNNLKYLQFLKNARKGPLSQKENTKIHGKKTAYEKKLQNPKKKLHKYWKKNCSFMFLRRLALEKTGVCVCQRAGRFLSFSIDGLLHCLVLRFKQRKK